MKTSRPLDAVMLSAILFLLHLYTVMLEKIHITKEPIMPRLSSPIENLKPHYTVVVVGSGYGGAIAASRMARAGQNVCVLERGKEFQPGEYPNTEGAALREMQVDALTGHLGSRTGLF